MNIGISEKNTKTVAEMLNQLVADEFVLMTKTYNYHWNIHSSSFKEMHMLYEEQYNLLHKIIDDVAERVPQIGHKAKATLKEFLSMTRLKEGPYFEQQEKQVTQILSDHESVIRNIRKDIEKCDDCKDAVSADLLTKILGEHEKMAWMLRSYLK